ncbi:MAG: hypothetical protein IKJ84_04110 [Oscillospiraceae bacterium]|nr:hypothetical protein [Oscillospiraceae bacterium]
MAASSAEKTGSTGGAVASTSKSGAGDSAAKTDKGASDEENRTIRPVSKYIRNDVIFGCARKSATG